jgi:hypothetical protein
VVVCDHKLSNDLPWQCKTATAQEILLATQVGKTLWKTLILGLTAWGWSGDKRHHPVAHPKILPV